MGTCCVAHLASKVRIYAPNAENGAVTVQILTPDRTQGKCDFCEAPGEFIVSYCPKRFINVKV